MNLPRYPFYTDDDFQEYSFFSTGPKGKIKKLVTFTKAQEDPIVYNLGFGDENPNTGQVSDLVVSNNEDRNIVLATVASTINTFCDHFGNHFVYIQGSTPSRTRLYQMSINLLWQEISKDFEVYGLYNESFTDFKPNMNYDGFLVKRKNKS